ncbi:MAG: chromosome segregation protein SMC [Planctomycetota bacterium]
MRLEKIVLNGFKSFADKTEFSFESPITAIVGPNGCGKSNVVDAVKWVLGEQRVKSLRSGHMADVIFSGSSSRKPMGSAEVSLFITNTMGTLPIEADEVQITRRIYKSGECEYSINNKVCRLKDIRELFLDTGVAAKAYSIIEQGQVEQLLTASKNDRRILFEEAAGISKYKVHKKEALRKLERTEQNLLRLADILSEVQKQLRSVKLQAGKARNYLQYTQRLKELQVNYSLVEYHKNHSATKEKKAVLEKLQLQWNVLTVDITKMETQMSEQGNTIIEMENRINQTDNSLVSVQSKIEQHLQRIEFLREKIEESNQRKEVAVERIASFQEQSKGLEDNLRQCQDDHMKCQESVTEKTGAIEELQETLNVINRKCNELEAELDDEKSGIIDIVRRTAQLHNELQSIGVYRSNLSSQKDRLASRAETARDELEKLLTEKAQYKARLGDIEKVLEELNQSLESKRKKSEDLSEQVVADNKRLAHNKEVKSALNSELSILTDMEARREGLNNAIKTILKSRSAEENSSFGHVEGLLADIIVADVEYASVVEAALEGKTDSLVSSSTSQAIADIEKIDKLDGRVNFICMDKIEPFTDKADLSDFSGIIGRAVEFVKYKSSYAGLVWQLLGKTIVVESVEAGLELSARLGNDYQFVTKKGQVVTGEGTIKLGPLGKTAGLISRKSRVVQLKQTLESISREIAEIENQIDRNSQKNDHLVKICKDLRTAIYEANTEQMQVNSKLSMLDENINRLKEEEPLIASEMELLAEQIAQSVQKEYNSKQKLDELETVNNERTARINELEASYDENKQQQESFTNELTDLRVALGQATEQTKSLKQTIMSLQSQLQQSRSATESAREEIRNCTSQSEEAQRDILKCESNVSELFVEKEKTQRDSTELHDQTKELIEQQKQTEHLIRARRDEENQIEQQINELKIELGQLEVKLQDLIERVREQLQIELVESYENYTESDIDWESVKEEINTLRGKIDRLGNVNLDAIDQQEELEKRNEFLSTQVEDLNKSKSQLQQLINKLNKTSREKFQETFDQVREHFQQLFRKLFGGGKADIVLEEAEDILEAGIEIIARPPGKEAMSISLLSGGEKTMAAIALLFAVFKAKPSPFCLLDEVDAALDEANNERFNMIVQEFQKDSQFIIITHSKRTMSIADILYGVTMQTRGVSKKISVKFGEYEPEPGEEPAAVA